MGGGGSPTLNEEIWQAFNDNGTDETDSTSIASANTAINFDLDTNFLIRFSVSNTGTKQASGVTLQLEYNTDSEGWLPVNASSADVRSAASTKLTDGNDTTERLSGAQTFDTSNAGQDDSDGLTGSNNLANGEEIESVHCVQLRSAAGLAGGEVILFRVTNGGTVLDNYNSTNVQVTVNTPPEESVVTLGSYTFTGQDPTSTVQHKTVVTAGSYTFSGKDPSSAKGFSDTVDAGSYTFSGQDVSETRTYADAVDAGSYTFTGLDPTSTYTPAAGNETSTVDLGTYTFTGYDITSAITQVEAVVQPSGGGNKQKYVPHLGKAQKIGLGGQQTEERIFQTLGADQPNDGVSKSVRELHKRHVEFTGKYVPLKTYDKKFKNKRKGYMKDYRKKTGRR